MHIWFNAGYSQTRDAIMLIRDGAVCSRLPLTVTLFATHSREDAPALAVADIAAIERDFDRTTPEGSAAYARWCLDFAREHKIDVFFAQRGRAAIQKLQAEFDAIGCRLVIGADADTLDIIEHKGRFYEACRTAGLPTPMTFTVTDGDEYRDAYERIRERWSAACIKPPVGVFGSGYFRISEGRKLFDQLMTIDNRVIEHSWLEDAIQEMGTIPPLLVMQHLPGTEWSVDCLCDDGRLIAGFVRAKQKHSQLIDANPRLMDLAARVAATFRLSNLVNIQFKSAEPGEGTPYILEINPRMSGGCAYGALAGVNLPWLQVMKATGRLNESHIPRARPTRAGAITQAIDISEIEEKLANA